jgi:NADH-ubiquinone oxidoreductase chain 4
MIFLPLVIHIFQAHTIQITIISLVIFNISLLFSLGWHGLSLFALSESSCTIYYVVLIVFTLSLTAGKKITKVLFILIYPGIFFFFCNNLYLFLVRFELTILPIVYTIFFFGTQPERGFSYWYFLIFSVFTTYPLLVYTSSTEIPNFFTCSGTRGFILYTILSPFLVKLPMYIVHLWLPKAHVEAPTLGSMILAGLLLKFGGWGLYRFRYLMHNYWIIYLELRCLLGIVISTFTASSQRDGKSLIAYSSICHINFLGYLLTLDRGQGKSLGILIILSHSLTSSIIFWVIGTIYNLTSTRQVYYLGAISGFSLSFGIMSIIIMVSNFGVPPTLSFWVEFYFLSTSFSTHLHLISIILIYLFLTCYFTLYFILCLEGRESKKQVLQEECVILGRVLLIFDSLLLKGLI